MRICSSCKSDRCGNHAACARRQEIAHDREASWFLTWFIIGATEALFQKLMGPRELMRPWPAALLDTAYGEEVRRSLALRVMAELESRTSPAAESRRK